MPNSLVDVKIEDNSKLFEKALAEQIEQALIAIGIAAEGNAKREITKRVYNTPESKSGYVRTGRLRNSITHASDAEEKAVIVGSNVEYAPYVELGTSKMIARPYLVPAVTQHTDEYKDILTAILQGT